MGKDPAERLRSVRGLLLLLQQIELSRCSFVQAEFFKTPLKGIDFTDCTLDGIRLSEGKSELKGAIVSSYQAAELARLLGVIIKE